MRMAPARTAPALFIPLFTEVRGIGILRTSHSGHSRKFALKEFCELRLCRVLRSWRIEAAEDGSPSREHILTQIDGVAKDVPELVKPRGAGSSGSRQPVLKTEKPLSRDALENMGPDEINSRWDTVRKFLAGKRS